jgi:hypothetical protein
MPQGPGTYGSQRGRPPKKKSGLKYQADKTLLDISEKMYEAQKKRATTLIDIDLQGFQLKSGNTSPFKQMGSSPLKQSYPSSSQTGPHGLKGTATEVKRIVNEKLKKPIGSIDAVSKEITRVAKGGKVQADLIKETARKSTKKVVKKGIAKTIIKKFASKFLGPIGWALTAIEVGKTAKDTIPSLKERAKSGNVNIGRKI